MLTTVTIAARNLLRNLRRSATTTIAIAIGSIALLSFGGFTDAVRLGLETSIVRVDGHLHVTPAGYLAYGASRPADYFIESPDAVIARITAEPDLALKIRLATPVLRLMGIAGNYAEDSSKTFMGVGIRPGDIDAMAGYDPYRLDGRPAPLPMRDNDPEGGILGVGMARMLGLCDELKVPKCQDRAPTVVTTPADAAVTALQGLAAADLDKPDGARVDLMAATGAGAPNVVSLRPLEARRQSATPIDDAYVAMPLGLAQRLLYGGADRATAIVLQLHRIDDAPVVKARLQEIIARDNLPLEVHGLDEINPMYGRVLAMFGAIFGFLSVVVGLVVLFTIVNTMTMAVMERVAEIGTLRAMGQRRSGVRRQFLTEGGLIGIAGATLGVALALLLAELVNRSGLSWTPPNMADSTPLRVLLSDCRLLAGCWAGMVVLAAVSALPPAIRASRLPIVDALRHA